MSGGLNVIVKFWVSSSSSSGTLMVTSCGQSGESFSAQLLQVPESRKYPATLQLRQCDGPPPWHVLQDSLHLGQPVPVKYLPELISQLRHAFGPRAEQVRQVSSQTGHADPSRYLPAGVEHERQPSGPPEEQVLQVWSQAAQVVPSR